MNRFVFVFVFFILMFTSAIYAADKIVAIVNGEIITEQELQEFENVLMYKLSSQYRNPEEAHKKFIEAQKDALNNLIEDRLILNEAKLQEYEIEDSSVEERLEQFRTQYPSEELFEADLVKRGLSIAALRNKILDQILMKQVVAHKVNSQIGVKPYEITEFYKENKDKFTVDEKVEYKALVSVDIDAASEAYETFKIAQRNGDLDLLFEKYKQSLRSGELEKTSVMDELAILFNDNTKVIYEPIKVGDEYYVFAVTKRTPKTILSLADAHANISNFVYQQKYQEKFDSWVDELKEKAIIEVKENSR